MAQETPCVTCRQVGGYIFAGVIAIGFSMLAVATLPKPVFRPRPPPQADVQIYSTSCQRQPNCVFQNVTAPKDLCCPTIHGEFLSCCSQIDSVAFMPTLYGMCYSPTPAKQAHDFVTDDYMADWASPLWGPDGRNDLQTIRDMGFTMVRMYGNDPRLHHRNFLDRAAEIGLSVIVAISNYPYTQDPNNSCAIAPPYNCFNEVRAQYRAMLQDFTVPSAEGSSQRVYHSAIKGIILFNEPELNVEYQGHNEPGGATEVWSEGYYVTAQLSALDGALAAENEMQVQPVVTENGTSYIPPFTVTYSFASCMSGNPPTPACKYTNNFIHRGGVSLNVNTLPGIPWMYDIVMGLLNPALYNYGPFINGVINSTVALQRRFMLGFNVQNRYPTVCDQCLSQLYNSPLGKLPIWIGEYKPLQDSQPNTIMSDFKSDMQMMKSFVDNNQFSCTGTANLGMKVAALSVFEFQVSYWKLVTAGGAGGADQLIYGVFDLGSSNLSRTLPDAATNWTTCNVWCLVPKINNQGATWVDSLGQIFRNEPGWRYTTSCGFDPNINTYTQVPYHQLPPDCFYTNGQAVPIPRPAATQAQLAQVLV